MGAADAADGPCAADADCAACPFVFERNGECACALTSVARCAEVRPGPGACTSSPECDAAEALRTDGTTKACGVDARCWRTPSPSVRATGATKCRWSSKALTGELRVYPGPKVTLLGAKGEVSVGRRLDGRLEVRLEAPFDTSGTMKVMFELEREMQVGGVLRLPAGTFVGTPAVDASRESLGGSAVLSESPTAVIQGVTFPCDAVRPSAGPGPGTPPPVAVEGDAVAYASTTTPLGPRPNLSLYAKPDGKRAFEAILAGVPLRVVEQRGAWARVEASWTTGAKLSAWVKKNDLSNKPVLGAGGAIGTASGSGGPNQAGAGLCRNLPQSGWRKARIKSGAFVTDDQVHAPREAWGRVTEGGAFLVTEEQLGYPGFVRIVEGPGLGRSPERCTSELLVPIGALVYE